MLLLSQVIACATAVKQLEPPVVTLAGLQLKSLDMFTQRFVLHLRVMNPNEYRLPLKHVVYDLSLDGVRIAQGTSNEKITVPPLGEAVIRVETETNLLALHQQMMQLLSSAKTHAEYLLQGHVSLLNRVVELPFSKQGAISLD